MPKPLDTAWVRARFPGLAGDRACFDNAGGSHVLDTAIERVANYLRTTPVQVGASYALSRLAGERLETATAAMAALVNAADSREIVFGPSSTSLLDRLARALLPSLQSGDEIIVTNADHESNIGPWRRLRQHGIVVKTWQVNPQTWQLELETLAKLMTGRTRLVCFTQVSNILGGIAPLADITRFVHDRGARVCVDGVAYVPHRLVDVRGWDVDYYVCSCYKVFGPHIAVLYGKHDCLLELANLNHEYLGTDAVPYKLQPGAYSYELAYGAAAVPDYLQELGTRLGTDGNAREQLQGAWQAVAEHEAVLGKRLLDYLADKRGVRIIGPHGADITVRVPTIAFVAGKRDSSAIPAHADKHNIGIRYGHFHAKRLIDALGLAQQNGVVRVSMAHYNTMEEVERLIACLDEVL